MTESSTAATQDAPAPIIAISNVWKYFGSLPALQDVSLDVATGERVVIIGPSGSGKSTLAKLIARFWDVDAGAVLVGGIDIREMSLTDLTEKISYVSQDNFLFNMSLRDNIRIGKPEATDKGFLACKWSPLKSIWKGL